MKAIINKLSAFYSKCGKFLITTNNVDGFYTMPNKHFHDKYEIYYLISGERYYFIKDKTFRIKKGSLVFINRGELHMTSDTDMPGHKRVVINFKKDYINLCDSSTDELFKLLSSNPYVLLSLSLKEQQQVELIFKEINEELIRKASGFELVIKGLLLKLLVVISRLIENSNEADYVSKDPKHEKISEIVKYINSGFRDSISISTISKQFFISPYYLSRIFKKTTGFTIMEYINNIRVIEAQKLLAGSGKKVIQIIDDTGFGSIASFNRIFKDITGCSPISYRRKSKGR